MDELVSLFFVLLLIGIVILIAYLYSGVVTKRVTSIDEIQVTTLNKNDIVPSQEYIYRTEDRTFAARFVLDQSKFVVGLMCTESSGENEFRKVSTKDILGCEVFTDSQSSGGVGRAIAGGVIAGGVGAIVGATTTKQKVSSYKMVVYINDIANPQFTFDLVNFASSKNEYNYIHATDFVRNVGASIKVLCESNSYEKAVLESKQKEEHQDDLSAVAVLQQYKKLLDDGIITQSEFDAKKQKLLSI